MILTIDIETKCNKKGCTESSCKHVLIPHLAEITCVGVLVDGCDYIYFQDVFDFGAWFYDLQACGKAIHVVGHNVKFDLSHIWYRANLNLSEYATVHCTQLLSTIIHQKIPEDWLEQYEIERKELNKSLKKGFSHRPAKSTSLKTLAPYFLEHVNKFWETPEDHSDWWYNYQDCYYTHELFKLFIEWSKAQGSVEFYKNLSKINMFLMEIEHKGIRIDLDKLDKLESETKTKMLSLEKKLKDQWGFQLEEYRKKQLTELSDKYHAMKDKAFSKSKDKSKEKWEKISAKYDKLFLKAEQKIEPLNLDSNVQLAWLLKEQLKYDIKDFNDKESTGKEVLEKLAHQGKTDVQVLLDYKKTKKLMTSFFPSYRELMRVSSYQPTTINTTFSASRTKTGRLASSLPNLQQIPPDLRSIFVAREGYKLATYDLSAIEPRLIAYYTCDPELFRIYNEGLDFHGVCTLIFFPEINCHPNEVKEKYPKERKLAKEVDLSLFYGSGAKRIKISSTKHGFNWSLDHCKQVHKNFKIKFKTAFSYKENVVDKQFKIGIIKNVVGRPLSVLKSEIMMKGFNKLIQSSASDLVLYSAYRINKILKEGTPLLAVHDELCVEVLDEKDKDLIIKGMTDWDLTNHLGRIPLLVEGGVSNSWDK